MKSHDFGQFTFNSAMFDKVQIAQLIKLSKNASPTLATEALFLQLILADELTKDDDEFVRTLITPKQADRALELKNGQSLWFAQGLINAGIANYLELGRILEEYNKLEIPPVETALTTYYETLRTRFTVDFPLAVDVINQFHSFLSETFNSSIVILPPEQIENSIKVGASVKIIGDISVVVALFAPEDVFLNLAKLYESFVEEIDDAYDAVSELLNVFTGHFVVRAAVSSGADQLPEPPRFGKIFDDVDSITLISDIGKFYIYIGKHEIFN